MTGERVTFEEFARGEYPRLVGSLTLYCGDPLVAEELAQDALVRARERWRRVSAMAAPGAWIHRVAMNLAKSRFRRAAAERRAVRRLASQAATTDRDPRSEEGYVVREAVAALPPRQREAILLRYFLGYPVADAAAALGITEGSCKVLTHRALESLRTRLDVDQEVGHDA